jgi:hypothetical protein
MLLLKQQLKPPVNLVATNKQRRKITEDVKKMVLQAFIKVFEWKCEYVGDILTNQDEHLLSEFSWETNSRLRAPRLAFGLIKECLFP